MLHLVIFGILSLAAIIISWRTLFNTTSHGFYRFFSWECIIWLFASNYKSWFYDPFSIHQIFSWIFLFWAAYLVIAGVLLLKKSGKPMPDRDGSMLYQFERTSKLVDHGIFRYIRHPLYSSLLFLAWGIFLKNPAVPLFYIAATSSAFLYLTAIFDEKECIRFFGNEYNEYMKRTKMFIPFLI